MRALIAARVRVCMHDCMYANPWMTVYVYVCILPARLCFVAPYECVYVRLYVCTAGCIYMDVYLCQCVCVCPCICLCVCVHVCMCVCA